MRASEYKGALGEFLDRYDYQPELTPRLDLLSDTPFSQHLINEIVLWKVDRYVSLDNDLLVGLNEIRNLKTGEHRRAESILKQLLRTHGVDLPMASTVLRFRNSQDFQIIDRHAYRAIYDKHYNLYPTTPIERKIQVYFDYLDELQRLCKSRGVAFETIDRLLYAFDKEKNDPLSKK
jgi:thermostable 8-oxoguanine DNA glycosylase